MSLTPTRWKQREEHKVSLDPMTMTVMMQAMTPLMWTQTTMWIYALVSPKAEVDDIFGEFEVDDDGFIASKDVIG